MHVFFKAGVGDPLPGVGDHLPFGRWSPAAAVVDALPGVGDHLVVFCLIPV